jgi:pyruvate dehydrogenase E2 component (dihydrolipoamide acetyltransferase)
VVGPALHALAEKYEVDLGSLQGTGPAGRITRQDILRARDRAEQKVSRFTAEPPRAARQEEALTFSSVSLTPGQAIVAKRVSQSAREKPTYRVTIQADMSAAIAFREKTKASWGAAVSWDSLFVKAIAFLLEEMPSFRCYIAGDQLRDHGSSDIAVAVGVGDDLYIPAVRKPLEKSVAVISREIGELAERASAHALGAADVEESCFLVSNLGMFPIHSFDAIIYPEHSAALAVGATTPTPVSDGKSIWIAPIAEISLAVDHRLINGRTAARFMTGLKKILETGAFT